MRGSRTPSGAAWVVYDASITSPEEFVGELMRMTSFDATVERVLEGQVPVPDWDPAEGDPAVDPSDEAEHVEHRDA